MDKDALIGQLRSAFAEELLEHAHAMGAALLALERDGGSLGEHAAGILRGLHTIKGGARAVDAVPLAELAHHLEDVMGRVQRGERALSPALIQSLLSAVDVMGACAGQLLEGRLDAARLDEAGRRVDDADGHQPAAAAERRTAPAAETRRLADDRLDAMSARSAELLSSVRRFEGLEAKLDELTGVHAAPSLRALRPWMSALVSAHRTVAHAATLMDDEVRRVRMQPLAEATRGLERVARDVAHESGKQVALQIVGAETQVDRAVLAGLRDPLLHIVRNAVDHGIETPEQRRAAGKPEEGRVELTAELRGGTVDIVVRDDGRGIDRDALRQALATRGSVPPDDDESLLRAVFEPGLSTSKKITGVSGRGVGLDVVRTGVESMRGEVVVDSQPGRGTRFHLRVPVSLATLRVLLVRAGGERLAIPTHQVRRLLRLPTEKLAWVEGRQSILQEGAPLPVVALAAVLGLGDAGSASSDTPSFVVLGEGTRELAFFVDELLDERELTVKPLPRRLAGSRRVVGAGLLPDGELALILNVPETIGAAFGRTSRAPAVVARRRLVTKNRNVLLVDDSITTRSLERAILESAGYRVTTAGDGAEAWRSLQERGADLIVSDVEMPNQDGFALVEAVRGSVRFRELPFILVTGRDSDADRERGLKLGASAYLVKTGFDQNILLETIEQLLRDE